MNNGKHGQGTHCTKMGAEYSLTKNTPNAPEFIRPICLPKPKSSGFQWTFVVREWKDCVFQANKTRKFFVHEIVPLDKPLLNSWYKTLSLDYPRLTNPNKRSTKDKFPKAQTWLQFLQCSPINPHYKLWLVAA